MASENLLNRGDRMFTFFRKIHNPNTILFTKWNDFFKTVNDKRCFLIISTTVFKEKEKELKEVFSITDSNTFLVSGELTEEQYLNCREKLITLLKKEEYLFLLAIGGGSTIDLAKLMKSSIIESSKDYGRLTEIVVIPTTPSSGSEFTAFALRTNQNKKVITYDPQTIPDIVILDHSFLKTIPFEKLKFMIIDILSHSIESFSSKFQNSFSDSLALSAYQKIIQQLRRKTQDDEFYLEIQIAGSLAGSAQGSESTGLAHSCAHYFGPKYNIPHGKALSYFLQEIVAFNMENTTLQQKFEKQGLPKERLLQEIQEIFDLLNIKEEKIAVEENFNITETASKIRKDFCTLTNPILPTEEQIKTIIEKKIIITPTKSKIDPLLELEPYSLPQAEKEKLFLEAVNEALEHHYTQNDLFKRFIDHQNFNAKNNPTLEQLPYLPITLFKELELITGKKEDIKNMIRSSATTSNKPSVIALDEITMKRQQLALRKIMSSFLGEKRRVFIIFDSRATVEKNGLDISSRASAIRGMAQFAKSMKFILNENLEFDPLLLEQALQEINPEEEICFFGFTWLLYKTYASIRNNPALNEAFTKNVEQFNKNRKILHIGGWKKLTDIRVDKTTFNSEISTFLGTNKESIIDFYGMTEQLGTVYPDCQAGYKHLPVYSEIIIRDTNTFAPLEKGKTGFIQLLTPIPHSYPGISLLTEDLGEIVGIDDCSCGRKGKYFIFKKRVEKAPIKGCGDTL